MAENQVITEYSKQVFGVMNIVTQIWRVVDQNAKLPYPTCYYILLLFKLVNHNINNKPF